MADPTYAELTTPMTREEVLAQQLAVLSGPDFSLPTSSWGPTDEPMATLAADADVLADLSAKNAGVAKAGVTDDAASDVLTVHAADVFDEHRLTGVPTIGTVTLTESAGSPQSWLAGALLFSSAVAPDVILVNVGAVSLSALGTASFSIQAAAPGVSGNVQAADLVMVSPVPGVSLSASSGTSWITQAGTDDESDEKLRLRCKTKWATLTTTGPDDAYIKWALDADATINRASVFEDATADATAGDPAVTVYCATSTGAPSVATLAVVDAYIQARRPIGILVRTSVVSTSTAYVKGTVTVRAASRVAAEAYINAQLDAWFRGEAIKVNGETVDGLGIGARMRVVQLVEIVMSAPGVVSFTPKKVDGTTTYAIDTDDLIAGANEVLVLSRSLTYAEVT